jgi:salicylate 5-hydroxylase large subunit
MLDNASPTAPGEPPPLAASGSRPDRLDWEGEGTHRIPFVAYTGEALYRRELERFFYKGHWCYVGLEAEVPNPGDFKRTVVGERSVILVRDA